eukprot:6496750-Prymnesium_polylepis.1
MRQTTRIDSYKVVEPARVERAAEGCCLRSRVKPYTEAHRPQCERRSACPRALSSMREVLRNETCTSLLPTPSPPSLPPSPPP